MTSIIDVAADPTKPQGKHDEVTTLDANALQQARAARGLLAGIVVPAMAPANRALVEQLVRALDRKDLFDEPILRDIETVLSLLQRQIDIGTYVGWQADLHHMRGGYERIELDDHARRLVPALAGLARLRAAVMTVLDLTRALSLEQDVTSD